MHETFMASQVVRQLDPLVAPYSPCRITGLRLTVGTLRQAVPELLAFALTTLLADGPHAGATVAIEQVAPRCRCNGCGRSWSADDWQFTCAACGSEDVASSGGDELIIEDITLEQEAGVCDGPGCAARSADARR